MPPTLPRPPKILLAVYYLNGHTQFVYTVASQQRIPQTLCVVSQVSVLKPILFLLYGNDRTMHSYRGPTHLYAEDADLGVCQSTGRDWQITGKPVTNRSELQITNC